MNTNENQIKTTTPYADKARKLLKIMSLKEKVHEITGNGIWPLVKGMVFKGHTLPVLSGGSKSLGIPSFSFTDGPRGVAVAKATSFPVTMARGASWDINLEREIGEAIAKEARAAGANYSGAVCINVLRHPAWGRAQETYGEDPFLLGEMGVALTKGLQKHNVMACVKHFALNNIENNRFHLDVQLDERTLREVYLPHFKKCVDAGAASIMSAYNKFRKEYCGHNHYLLTHILRNEWGFRGFVSSDWMWGLKDTKKGILAGMNVEMPGANYYSLKKIKKLLRNGEITMQNIDNLVLPVIETKLEWAERKDLQQYPTDLIACKEHSSLALDAARKSMVLLKNKNNLLPLNKQLIKKIAIVGSQAKTLNDGDKASSKVVPPYIISPFEGIEKLSGGDIKLLYANENELDKIRTISKEADAVIIIAGYNPKEEGEFINLKGAKGVRGKNPILTKLGILSCGDRLSLELPERDLKVINTVNEVTDKAIVCLIGGSAITMESWKENVGAILMGFYSGMEGGNALAEILFGKVNPSGKLPFTLPKAESHLPHFDPYCDTIEYGYYHGYTLLEKNGIKPAFPFGFGLSYTEFSFSNLIIRNKEIDSIFGVLNISMEIKNTGNISGEEVIQVYVGFSNSNIDRPQKLLRGFKKINLEADESRIVEFSIPVTELAFYDTEHSCWEIEKMEYEVYAGNSSDEESLMKSTFVVV